MAEGIIINYRRGRRTQKTNQMVIEFDDVDKEKAESMVGKKVVYETPGKEKKQIKGEITATHGGKGAVRALFERGLPGQAIGDKVKLE